MIIGLVLILISFSIERWYQSLSRSLGVLGTFTAFSGVMLLRRVRLKTFREILLSGARICPKCGYDLRGHQDCGICPECGQTFDPVSLHKDWHAACGGKNEK